MAEEKAGLEIDDWLNDLDEDTPASPVAEVMPGELDQSDIDSLLGVGEDDEEASSDDSGGVDQSDIDALFRDDTQAVSAPVAPEEEEGVSDLAQTDIDSLFAEEEKSSVAPAPDNDFDLDQSDIDGLFAGDGEEESLSEPVEVEEKAEQDEDDLDLLFTEIDGKEPVSSEAVAPEENNFFGQPDDGKFDDDEFDFGDLPDIPDEEVTIGIAQEEEIGKDGSYVAGSSAASPDFIAETTMDDSREMPSASGTDQPSTTGNKKVLAIAALCLVLLLGGGGYWFFTKNKNGEQAPLPPPAQEKSVAPVVAEPVIPPNVPPVAIESRWRMTQANEALAIELSGTDENNDPLKFEIVTPPKFGRISGDPPMITYLPDKDFPGEDSFEFRVLDGQAASAPATVGIMGPEEVKPVAAAEAPKKAPKARPVVAARNVRLKTLSTVPLTINWKKIWAAANPGPFNTKVSVEILDGPPLRGALQRLDRSRHRYVPDRYFGGKEVVRYRFKAGGVFSRVRELTIMVKDNDKPPILALRPVADSYKVGESVLLDAGLTRDDSPGNLRYSWKQLGGPPVEMEKRPGDGSAVSFVVPGFFRTEQNTRIIIRVTATDPGGQRTSKEISITPVSKRHSALWGIQE